jgi:hypothetical protein
MSTIFYSFLQYDTYSVSFFPLADPKNPAENLLREMRRQFLRNTLSCRDPSQVLTKYDCYVFREGIYEFNRIYNKLPDIMFSKIFMGNKIEGSVASYLHDII